MDVNNFNAMQKEAEEQLRLAESEMFKSKDDMVPFTVCSSSRKSIVNYLKSFLLKNGTEVNKNYSVEELLQECIPLEPRLKEVQLNGMFCRNENQDISFCTGLNRHKNCLQIAHQVKDIMTKDHWPLSKRFK